MQGTTIVLPQDYTEPIAEASGGGGGGGGYGGLGRGGGEYNRETMLMYENQDQYQL